MLTRKNSKKKHKTKVTSLMREYCDNELTKSHFQKNKNSKSVHFRSKRRLPSSHRFKNQNKRHHKSVEFPKNTYYNAFKVCNFIYYARF